MATEKRLIDANAIENGIALYVAENAYLNDTALDALKKVAEWIDEAPTVDAVEVVHGRWIHTAIEDDDWGGTFHKWTCSICDFATGHNPNGTNYCPNCGAKMDGDGNG